MILNPEQEADVRRRYAGGEPVAVICARYEIGKATLYNCLDGRQRGTKLRLPAIPRRHVFRHKLSAPGGPRRALVARLWQAARRQVEEIEEHLARAGLEPAERERDTRMLAILVKTLRELATLEDTQIGSAGATDAPRADDNDDDFPADIDELRRELARRVDLLRQRRAAAAGSG